MTDGVIDDVAEEVLGTTSKSGFGHLHWLFEFTRALGAPDEVITDAVPNVDAMASSSFLYCLAQQQPVVRADIRWDPGDREPDPCRVHQGRRRLQGALHRHPATRRLCVPHHPHLGRRGPWWPRRRVRRAVPRHRSQTTIGGRRVLRRSRADPPLLGQPHRVQLVLLRSAHRNTTSFPAMAVERESPESAVAGRFRY